MRHLLIILMPVVTSSLAGCTIVDCGTTRHIDGVLVDATGKPVSGWVGATEREAKPEETFDSISDREEWGEPEKSWLALTHTREDGRFSLDHGSGIRWGYTLLFGFIPLSSTTPPEVPVLDHIFLHVHDGSSWHSVRVDLSSEQQNRREPGERWISLGRIMIDQAHE